MGITVSKFFNLILNFMMIFKTLCLLQSGKGVQISYGSMNGKIMELFMLMFSSNLDPRNSPLQIFPRGMLLFSWLILETPFSYTKVWLWLSCLNKQSSVMPMLRILEFLWITWNMNVTKRIGSDRSRYATELLQLELLLMNVSLQTAATILVRLAAPTSIYWIGLKHLRRKCSSMMMMTQWVQSAQLVQ